MKFTRGTEPAPAHRSDLTVREIGPAKRVLRDSVSGTPLPVQMDAPDIIRAVIQYPFAGEEPPSAMAFTAPPDAEIGFVVYHNDVAVNVSQRQAGGRARTAPGGEVGFSVP